MRIIELLDAHQGTFYKCKGCSICTEIKQLRKQLERDPADKFKYILDKGPDMRKSDIVFLLDNEVQRKVIWKALGITNAEFWELMRNFGLMKRGEPVMALDITVDEFIQLHHIDGKSFGEISEIKGFKKNALSNWKWLNKEEINNALKTSGLLTKAEKKPSGIKPTPRATDTKSAEYERLIKALRDDLTDSHNQCEEKDELIRQLKKAVEKYEHLNAACEDVENEIAGLQSDLEEAHHHELELKTKIAELEVELLECLNNNKPVSEYEKEIKALKELLRLYI